MFQGRNIIFIHGMRFLVTGLISAELLFESASLFHGIVKLAVRIRNFHRPDIQLESFHEFGRIGP